MGVAGHAQKQASLGMTCIIHYSFQQDFSSPLVLNLTVHVVVYLLVLQVRQNKEQICSLGDNISLHVQGQRAQIALS